MYRYGSMAEGPAPAAFSVARPSLLSARNVFGSQSSYPEVLTNVPGAPIKLSAVKSLCSTGKQLQAGLDCQLGLESQNLHCSICITADALLHKLDKSLVSQSSYPEVLATAAVPPIKLSAGKSLCSVGKQLQGGCDGQLGLAPKQVLA